MRFELLSGATLLALSTLVSASPCTSSATAVAAADATSSADDSAATATASASASDSDDDSDSDPTPTSSADDSDPTDSADSSSSAAAPAATTTAPSTNGTATSGGSIPDSAGSSVLSAVQTIAAGESFDGGLVTFDRGVSCTGQSEGGDSDAVFELEEGASISNVIIGPNQIEGIHCFGKCTLTNVWWSAVCEDAFTIKEQADGDTTTITGGGASGAEDKVLQHNGGGTLHVSGFTVDTFGKLYRSCGNCNTQYARHVIIDDVSATDGSVLVGINGNLGDTATINSATVSGVDTICEDFIGNDSGDEPTENASGPSDVCIYDPANISGDTSDKKMKRGTRGMWNKLF